MNEKKYAPQSIKVKAVDRELYQVRFVMSTPDVDRHGEVIDQNGWKLDNYLQNPVVLWGHDQSIPAIGKIISLEKVSGNLEGVVQFAYEEHELAATIFELVAGGYINAVSVGFMNTKWAYDENSDILTLVENELYELSVVNVPANARALAKSKGIDMHVLDSFDDIQRRASAERAKAIGMKGEEEEEKGEVEPESTEVKVDVEVETPGTVEAPVEEPEDGSGEDGEVKAAIETLCKASPSAIKEAVEVLTSKAKDADIKAVEPTPAAQGRVAKKYSAHSINRAVRVLLRETQ